MRLLIRSLFILLAVLTGATFLYSAYTKLVPVASFEYTMVEAMHIPLLMAAIAARFFIGIEAALGALIVLHFWGSHKWVLKSAFLLLAVFCVYLIALWIKDGNNVNCGCFGDAIWMSPSTSLIKNGVLMAIIALLIRYRSGLPYKWTNVSAPVVLICTVALAYIIFPVFSRYKIDLHDLYTSDTTLAPQIDLSKGKHIIAFLNPQCMHCRKAGLKMHDMLQKDPSLPFYLIIGGTTSDLTSFWKDTHAENMPHTRLASAPFSKYTKNVYPLILWLNNGWVDANTGYPELNQKVIEKWAGLPLLK